MSDNITRLTHGHEVPRPGAQVDLLSASGGPTYAATVESWDETGDGLVVTARVDVPGAPVALLADQLTWLILTEPDGGLTVFSGLPHPAGASSLDITGVATVAREGRRRSLRAPAAATADLSTRGRPGSRALRVVDISRGGVRVALHHPAGLSVGEHVDIDVRLEDGAVIAARGEVTRVDESARHAVVRFDDLRPEHGTHIDRYVLLRLSGPV